VGRACPTSFIILAAVYWTRYARIVRGEVLSVRERDYVRLAVVAGCLEVDDHAAPHPAQRHQLRHPCWRTLQLGQAIIAEATLSFLGVGVPPPSRRGG